MIDAFEKLSNEEIELMLRAPMLVCILIAGADGRVDRKEIKKAMQHTRKAAMRSKQSLVEYFKSVETDFEDKFKVVLQGLPVEVKERNRLITEELTRLNSVFPKVPAQFSAELYTRLRDLARQVAESSGGLLGMNAVGDDEAQFVDLPMIQKPT